MNFYHKWMYLDGVGDFRTYSKVTNTRNPILLTFQQRSNKARKKWQANSFKEYRELINMSSYCTKTIMDGCYALQMPGIFLTD